ncbi:MAG TPA: AcvB/VirJ family lysyl-phosphatidylglycerol hydrolase, partial [Thermoanaerobaculia bacterium]
PESPAIGEIEKTLTGQGAAVIAVDLKRYFTKAKKEPDCYHLAGALEMLGKRVQKKLEFASYTPPILVGYGGGATFAYAALAQANPNTFRGAISLGFCPDAQTDRPMCRGAGLTWPAAAGKTVRLQPMDGLEQPWIELHGATDRACSAKSIQDFVGKVKQGEMVALPGVGHGFLETTGWQAQLKQAFLRVADQPHSPDASGSATQKALALPLQEWTAKPGGDSLAFLVSGDGGWTGVDRKLASTLAEKGVPVVGLNSLQYLWNGRTAEGSGKDLERILRAYLAAWNRQDAILIGYSLGAEVIPFMANRLPADLQKKIRLIALLGPTPNTNLEIRIMEEVGKLAVLPEVEKLRGSRVLCIYGNGEKDSLCPEIKSGKLGKATELPGSHAFGGDYAALADRILQEAQPAAERPGAAANGGAGSRRP